MPCPPASLSPVTAVTPRSGISGSIAATDAAHHWSHCAAHDALAHDIPIPTKQERPYEPPCDGHGGYGGYGRLAGCDASSVESQEQPKLPPIRSGAALRPPSSAPRTLATCVDRRLSSSPPAPRLSPQLLRPSHSLSADSSPPSPRPVDLSAMWGGSSALRTTADIRNDLLVSQIVSRCGMKTGSTSSPLSPRHPPRLPTPSCRTKSADMDLPLTAHHQTTHHQQVGTNQQESHHQLTPPAAPPSSNGRRGPPPPTGSLVDAVANASEAPNSGRASSRSGGFAPSPSVTFEAQSSKLPATKSPVLGGHVNPTVSPIASPRSAAGEVLTTLGVKRRARSMAAVVGPV